MKRFFKFLLKFLLAFLILIGLLFGASKIFEQKIIAKALQALNKQLNVPVQVDKVSLNLISQFPYATIELYNVRVESSKGISKNDFKGNYSNYLMELKKVSLSFNIKSLRTEQLELSKIILSEGQINLLVDGLGVSNYNIFPSDPEPKKEDNQSTDLQVILKLLQFNKVDLRLVNVYKQIDVQLVANNFQVRGAFKNDKYQAQTKGELILNRYVNQKLVIIPEHTAHLKLDLDINNKIIHIVDGGFSTQGMTIKMLGTINFESDETLVDLALSGDHISIADLLETLPIDNSMKSQLKANGKLEFNASISGKFTEKISPRITSTFKIDNGDLVHNKTGVRVHNIRLNGTFNNRTIPYLSIPEFSLATPKSTFSGSLSLSSFENPVLKLISDFTIDAFELNQLAPIPGIDSISGQLQGHLFASGKIDKEFTTSSIFKFKNSGEVSITNFNVVIKDSPIKLNHLTADLSLVDDLITIKKATGNFMNIPSGCSGTISNLISSLSNDYAQVNISGNAYFGKVNYAQVEALFAPAPEGSTPSKVTYNVNAGLLFNQFEYNGFLAENVSGQFIYYNDQLWINQLNLYAFGGNIQSNIHYAPSLNNTDVFSYSASTTNIEISQVFKAFKNFDQTFLTDQNIKGKLTGNLKGEILLADDKFLEQSLDMLGHFKITNGELINFEPAMELSSFCDITELQHLKFATLENDIMISNGVVNIPKMDISCNVMDITLFGQQEFNGSFEYHIKLLLSDILGKKKKNLQQQQSKFGTIEDDGLGQTSIYLVATGINGETTVKFDKKELGNHLKQEMAEEKKELKQVLNKEFGWFAKDSIKEPDQKKQPQFQIEWDDE